MRVRVDPGKAAAPRRQLRAQGRAPPRRRGQAGRARGRRTAAGLAARGVRRVPGRPRGTPAQGRRARAPRALGRQPPADEDDWFPYATLVREYPDVVVEYERTHGVWAASGGARAAGHVREEALVKQVHRRRRGAAHGQGGHGSPVRGPRDASEVRAVARDHGPHQPRAVVFRVRHVCDERRPVSHVHISSKIAK